MDYSNQKDQTIILKCKGELKQIDISSILYVTCDSYLSTIHLAGSGQKETNAKLLKEFEQELYGYSFIRINHNTLLNPRYIQLIKRKKRYVILKTGEKLIVSRRRWYLLKEVLGI